MIKGGYILQPRIIEGSDTMRMPPVTREIWLHVLRNVNHKDFNNIPRGSGFFQYSEIQNSLSWYVGYRKEVYSKSQIAKSLRRLNESNMIETTKEIRGVIISVCNYDYYQDPKNYEGNNEGNAMETRKPQYGSTINKNVKNEENVDNVKNEEKKKIKTLLSQVDESTVDHTDLEYYQIAFAFWQLIKANLTELDISIVGIENAEYKSWVNPIRLLMQTDKRTIEEIREVFNFLKDDDFWKEQIRSTAKLRKKNKDNIKYFEVLLIKSRNEKRRKVASESSKSGVSNDYKQSILNRLRNPVSTEEVPEN